MSLITFLQADAPEMVLEADAPKCDAHLGRLGSHKNDDAETGDFLLDPWMC